MYSLASNGDGQSGGRLPLVNCHNAKVVALGLTIDEDDSIHNGPVDRPALIGYLDSAQANGGGVMVLRLAFPGSGIGLSKRAAATNGVSPKCLADAIGGTIQLPIGIG